MSVSEKARKALETVEKLAAERGYGDDPEERFFGPPLVEAQKTMKKKSQPSQPRKSDASRRSVKADKPGQASPKKKFIPKSAKLR